MRNALRNRRNAEAARRAANAERQAQIAELVNANLRRNAPTR